MPKYREYRREFTKNEHESIKKRYSEHLKYSRGGFLTKQQRERLLGIKKKERETPDSDFWWKIEESLHGTLMDMKMICDIANEKQLQEIFGTKNPQKFEGTYPITSLLTSLLPSMLSVDKLQQNISHYKNNISFAKTDLKNAKNNPSETKRLKSWITYNEIELKKLEKEFPERAQKLEEQEWRKLILKDIGTQVLHWYLYSGLFETDSHRRMIIDVMDAISIMSSGKKMNIRQDPDQTGMFIV